MMPICKLISSMLYGVKCVLNIYHYDPAHAIDFDQLTVAFDLLRTSAKWLIDSFSVFIAVLLKCHSV